MLFIILVSTVTVTGTIVVHALGTAWWLHWLRHRYPNEDSRTGGFSFRFLRVLIFTALILMVLHVIEVFFWALVYLYLPESGLGSLEEAMYFSFTTFTTLGYGDITLPGDWRILTGLEALNGILLAGWSTALSFAVIQRMWQMAGPDGDHGGSPVANSSK